MEELDNQVYKRSTEGDIQDLRHRFIKIGDTVFTAINKDLVGKFNIDERTWAYQYATENGIYIAFGHRKNKVIGNSLEANNQDYEA